MNKINIYKQDGSVKDTMELSSDVYNLPWNDALVHQVITSIENCMRSGTAHTKIRNEVRGGGKKPWKQKGTGRARHGSIRSPLWVGGGVTFGPRNEKNYATSVNKKARSKAFFTVISEKIRNNAISFVDEISFETPSTKSGVAMIEGICAGQNEGRKNRCLVVFAGSNDAIRKSFSNIPGVSTSALEALSTRDVSVARQIVFVNPTITIEFLDEKAKSVRVGKQLEVVEK